MSEHAHFNPDGLALAAGYAQTMEAAVLPAINARRTDRTVAGYGGRPLFTSRFDADNPRGTVLIVHGFTENVDKFSELIYSLLENGLSVLAYDQRGHGRSWRPEGLDEASLTHVEAFDDYVRDMEIICETCLNDMPKPYRLFCHSMGGAVTALFLESHKGVFDHVAMCAPMIAPSLGSMPKAVAVKLCQIEKLLKRGAKRIMVSKPYSGVEDFDTACANGPERFAWYEALRAKTPAFQNNGPSYNWTLESIKVTARILRPGAPEGIDAEVRLYTAALDQTVLPKPQELFIARVPKGQHIVVEGAKHEIYRSPDAVLFPWWHEVLAFLK